MSSGTTAAESVASTTAAKHGHRVAKTMPGLPSVAAQKQFFQRSFALVVIYHAAIVLSPSIVSDGDKIASRLHCSYVSSFVHEYIMLALLWL